MRKRRRQKKTTKKAPKKDGAKKEAAPAAPGEVSEEAPAAATGGKKAKHGAEPAYMQAWGMAGCGLGGMVLGKSNSKGAQIGAWFLNASVSSNQSFAISSKFSGCDVGPDIKTAQIEQKVFVDVNFASLSREAAQGGGQHLSAFAAILGCDGDARTRFIQMSRDRYAEIFSSNDPDQVLTNYRATIHRDPELVDQCSRALQT